jgi:hypothetical protein
VVSQESFRNKHELFLIKPAVGVGCSPLVNAMPLAPKAATEDVLLLRTCLKRGTSSTFESESPLSIRSSLPSSSPATSSPGTRQVLFNTCVERSEIAAAPLNYTCPDDENGSCLGLIFNEDQSQSVYSLDEVIDQFRPQPCQSLFEDDSSDEENDFYPMLPTTLLERSDAILLPLRPGQIAPLPCSDSDPKVLFVPPKGMEDLDEGELRPYEARPLRRRVRIVDFSDILFSDEEDEEVEVVVEQQQQQQPESSGSSGPEAGGGLSRLASGDSWFTDGWLSDNWKAPVEDENTEYAEYEPFGESEVEVGGTSSATNTASSIWEEQGTTYSVVRTHDVIIHDANIRTKDDNEVEEVDGELYYECEEGSDGDEDYDYEADSDDEDAGSSDGFELVGMVANSVSSFFW